MNISIDKFVIGPVENNTWLVSNSDSNCLVIDPAIGSQLVVEHIRSQGLQLQAILLTHGHCDHLLGLEDMLTAFPGTPVYIHPDDQPYLTDVELNGSVMVTGQPWVFEGAVEHLQEGDNRVGDFRFDVLHLPGHTPGGVSLNFDGHCFTGDSLFAGSVGRTDFLGSNSEQLMHSLHQKLMKLPADTRVYCGHGPESTIAAEAASNPFLV